MIENNDSVGANCVRPPEIPVIATGDQWSPLQKTNIKFVPINANSV